MRTTLKIPTDLIFPNRYLVNAKYTLRRSDFAHILSEYRSIWHLLLIIISLLPRIVITFVTFITTTVEAHSIATKS